MSALTLAEAIRAPLQEDRESVCDGRTRAVSVSGELFYHRRSGHYREWIEVFTHRGESLGTFRSLEHFREETGSGPPKEGLFQTDAGRALHRELRTLAGHRIVAVDIREEAGCPMPFSILLMDDGRAVVLQSDPEGNDGGFPLIVKPESPEGGAS